VLIEQSLNSERLRQGGKHLYSFSAPAALAERDSYQGLPVLISTDSITASVLPSTLLRATISLNRTLGPSSSPSLSRCLLDVGGT
jgi:hypothetical protein